MQTKTSLLFALLVLCALPARFTLRAEAATTGTVVAWGDNAYGQTTIPAGLSGVTAISGGYYHNVALKSDGTVVAWGRNDSGQTSVPSGLSGVTAISGGDYHTVALKSDGTVVAWGKNDFGQTTVPAGLSGVIAIAAGGYHTVALKSDGTVVAWGDDFWVQTTVPAGLSGVTAIAAGDVHTVALKSDGTVVAWGNNGSGQTSIPAGLSGVAAIAGGGNHTVALIGPVITMHPASQSFPLGGGVSLSVVASGTGLSYQWQLNGTNIPGATSPTLNLVNLTAAKAGAYRVVVSSSAGGSTTSQNANLLFHGDMKFYGGTTLGGPVGQQFRVDYADVVTVGTTNWLVLTNITLPSSPYLVIDPNSPGRTQRYYRAVPVP